MGLADLVCALSEPSAYPHHVDNVDVHQTHISVVFLAGSYAYKVKKPLSLGFLDYSTLERRRGFCEQETILNRRLAPEVYLGVVPVTREPDGLRVEGQGPVVEWAVKMVRLPADATLEARLRRGLLGPEHVELLARRIAAFHADAATNAEITAAGRFGVVADNARQNFAHAAAAVSRAVFERARDRTERCLDSLRPLIEARAERGVPRDGHGDLRLDHVYFFPDRPPPADLVIVDSIEFNARFRHADPVADMAFLDMDLVFHGRRDLARIFSNTYFLASGDAEGRSLLPFYRSYRAAVRGKVEGIESLEPEVPDAARSSALVHARAHWLLALGEVEEPARRPCLVLVGGLPGSGKSTLARGLAGSAGFEVIRTDVVRKELAARAGLAVTPASFEEGIYTPEWTEWTYAECLQRADALLFDGRRVLIDATFGREASRRLFLDAAVRWGVPGLLLLCKADQTLTLARLERRRGDASDADGVIYEQAARRWEDLGALTRLVTREIDTGGSAEHALHVATEALRDFECAGPE
ncbi:MAG: AAA family ATPase [Isosphaeraceae bacterium]|nr:AAA family ATPase [Isosphaeraceae bacterium]